MRVVILGTGTDVGKTYVTACLARGLAERGKVLALKPIESGVATGAPGDAGVIAGAAGHAALLSPWRYARPVSPHLGARASATPIDVTQVVAWVHEHERAAAPAVSLVELAGGAFSPLGLGVTNVDLALALAPALWLLVAPDALGVLHDVTATTRALPRLPDAIVLSGSHAADASTGSNAAELSALDIAQVLEVVPAGGSSCAQVVDWVWRHAASKSGQ